MAWMLVVYVAALVLLFITSFWQLNPLSQFVDRKFTLDNYQQIITDPSFRKVALRTLGMAIAVTLIPTRIWPQAITIFGGTEARRSSRRCAHH